MAIPKKTKEEKPVFVWPVYSKDDLDTFERLLERHQSETKFGKLYNIDEAAVEYGAMTKSSDGSYAVIVAPAGKGYEWPTKYELFQHLLNAWRERLAKIEWAEKKSAEFHAERMDPGTAARE